MAKTPPTTVRWTSQNGLFLPSRKTKIALVGDSIPAGQVLSGTNGGIINYPRSDWDGSRGLYSTGIACTNIGTTFFTNLWPDGNCAASDAISISWNATNATAAVAVAGDSAGVPVNVTGGGFFHLVSGTNGKGVVIMVRWRNAGASATDTGTVSGARNRNAYALASMFMPALFRLGMRNLNVMNFGYPSDTPQDILNRLSQVIAESPDWVFLHCLTNDHSQTSQVHQIIDALVAANIRVLVVPMIQRGDNSTASFIALQAFGMLDTFQYAVNKGCCVYDAWSLLAANGTSGSALVRTGAMHTDFLHPNLLGGVIIGNDMYVRTLAKLFLGNPSPLPLGNAIYDATNNPLGNYIGNAGTFAGTSGTLGANPVPTGSLATGWTDSDIGGGSPAFASVVYSQPATSLTDPFSGTWQQVVASMATGSACRRLTVGITTGASGLQAGARVQARLLTRIKSAHLVNRFEPWVLFNPNSNHLSVCGVGLPMNATEDLADSGVLYLESAPFTVPVGTNFSQMFIDYGCADGGSITLQVANAVVENYNG